MSVKIISTEEFDECTCGIITDRKLVWIFGGSEIHNLIPFCRSCEKDLKYSMSIEEELN